MSIKTLWHTVCHLRPRQVIYQIRNRLKHYQYKQLAVRAPGDEPAALRGCEKGWCMKDDVFTFLNISERFSDWNDTRHGMLRAYNLNYMDWLNQPEMTFDEGAKWINKFINDLPDNKIGLDPYPIALRGINWIKFITRNKDRISADSLRRWNDSLYSQYHLLTKKLEYHLMGNHLLEDAFSWYIAAIYFDNEVWKRRARKLLIGELKEQVLPDGAHYEQSPMYHCILLDRLLDCINFDGTAEPYLIECGERMLGHLESIVWRDKTIPLFNDSADGIAPAPTEIFDYARRLGLEWNQIPMYECGYRKFINDTFEAIVDIGNMTASYQPGHSHADTFSYELRVNGRPFIVDTGISTYEKNKRRQYERSTAAHNTVTVGDRDSSEVWGGFRVGSRAEVKVLADESSTVIAEHNGFGKKLIHRRIFCLENGRFIVRDRLPKGTQGENHIHLGPSVEITSIENNRIVTSSGEIIISGATAISIKNDWISNEYNKLISSKVISVTFIGEMEYDIIGLR